MESVEGEIRMKMKITIAVLLCLLVLPIAFAAFPGNWWGKVYIGGEQVPDGTTINAYIDDNLVATTHVGDWLGSGYYELIIEANNGDTIIFKIGSIEAGTAVFSDGAHPQLDLSLTDPACGDTLCNGDETCTTCPGDCGACPPSNGGSTGGTGGGSPGGSISSCTPVWECTAWTTCSLARSQTRTCTDKNNCGTTTGKPAEIQTCNYVPPTTTKTQEEEPEELTSGEGDAPTEGDDTPGTTATEPSGGFGGIIGMFFQNITGANKWKGLGVIILVLLVGYLFYFFVLKKKDKKE